MTARKKYAAGSLLALVLAAVCLAVLFLPQCLAKQPLFTGAERYTFYSVHQSSQALITVVPPEEAARTRRQVTGYTGESAQYRDAADAFAQAKKYGARLVAEQTSADVTDYYYYAPCLGGGIRVGGRRVNLHVAVRGEGAAVGYPLIFGGY